MLKTILILGGLGYLGGRLAQALLSSNNFKIILGTRNNQAKLPYQLEGCKLAQIDLLDKNSIQKNLKNVEIVIHLAAINAQDCEINPSNAILVNSIGTLNLVQVAQDLNVKEIIYFSTAHIYGSPLLGDITENTLAKPMSHYAITHRVAEDYIIKTGKESRISTTVLRLTNAVGFPIIKQANCWMLVANDIAKQIVEKNQIMINSSGMQLRDFMPISNIVSAVFILLGRNSNGEVFNLGSGVSLSILDLAKVLSSRAKVILDINSTIVKGNNKENETNNFSYKIDRILSLGYLPVQSLENEIDDLLVYVNKEFGTRIKS